MDELVGVGGDLPVYYTYYTDIRVRHSHIINKCRHPRGSLFV